MTDKANIGKSAPHSRDFPTVRELLLTYVKIIILCILLAVFFSLVNKVVDTGLGFTSFN